MIMKTILSSSWIRRKPILRSWDILLSRRPLSTIAVSPEEVDPSFLISPQNPLPPTLQQAVQDHVKALYTPPETDSHIVRRYHLDKKRLRTGKKREKEKKKAYITLTPFVLVGAHQAIAKRLSQQPTPNGIAKTFMNEPIRYDWFQQAAIKIEDRSFKLPKNYTPRALIIEELMDMVIRAHIEPYLPPHALCLQENTGSTILSQNLMDPVLDLAKNDPMFVNPEFLTWNLLGDEGFVSLNELQLHLMTNLMEPYMNRWPVDLLYQLRNKHKRKGKKSMDMWDLFWYELPDSERYQHAQKFYIGSYYSITNLPATLLDLVLLTLDYSSVTKDHPLWAKNQQHVSSDKKKQRSGTVKARIPKSLHDCCRVGYYRIGPCIVVPYEGPQELGEMIANEVSQHLKSSAHFDRKLVTNAQSHIPSSSSHRKKKKKSKEQRDQFKVWEELFRQHQEECERAKTANKQTRWNDF